MDEAGEDVEWVVWEARTGTVTLTDGKRVKVRGGDELLTMYRNGTTVFIAHKSAIRH